MKSASRSNSGGVACLVLAAGAGTRFAGQKQLAHIDGRPILERPLAAARAAAGLQRTILVLGSGADAVRTAIDAHGAEVVVCAGWSEGMAAALRFGIAAVSDCDAALILLGDQPLVGTAAIERVLSARDGEHDAVRATYGGRPGHPVLIERSLFPAVAQVRGDWGARELLELSRVAKVACDDVADPLDVDLPADVELAAARLRRD